MPNAYRIASKVLLPTQRLIARVIFPKDWQNRHQLPTVFPLAARATTRVSNSVGAKLVLSSKPGERLASGRHPKGRTEDYACVSARPSFPAQGLMR
jgi:hypothetical protein